LFQVERDGEGIREKREKKTKKRKLYNKEKII
jgi:hypothetical protein